MDIMYWIVKLFIWAVTLALSVIPGIILGYFGEVLFDRFGYWIGFILGVIIFLIKLSPILSFNDAESPQDSFLDEGV